MSKHVILASCKGVLPNLFTRVKSAPMSNNFLTPLMHLLVTHQCNGLLLKIWNLKHGEYLEKCFQLLKLNKFNIDFYKL